jgi:hypothetical protein
MLPASEVFSKTSRKRFFVVVYIITSWSTVKHKELRTASHYKRKIRKRFGAPPPFSPYISAPDARKLTMPIKQKLFPAFAIAKA